MTQIEILEGTGEELQRHLQQVSKERFRLIPLANGETLHERQVLIMPQATSLEEEERLLDELAALGRHLPASAADETYSRETIYADHD